jgi:hypothetical protein
MTPAPCWHLLTATAIVLLAACGTDPRRTAASRPAPEPARAPRPAAEQSWPGPQPREEPATRPAGAREARAVRARVSALGVEEPTPVPGDGEGVGVTSIDFGTVDGALQLFVADRGELRILESEGRVFTDVGPLRLPRLAQVERVVPIALREDRAVLLVLAAGRIHVLERDPHGVYVDRTAEVLPGAAPVGVTWIAAADFDADGDLDLLAAAGGAPRILANDGEDRLVDRSAEHLPPDPPSCRRVFPYDVGEDGVVDLVTADPEIHVLVQDGRGRFVDESARRLPEGSRAARSLVALDADLDGGVDAVLLRGSQPDALWLNDGRGHLVAAAEGFMPGLPAREGLRFDVDGDGRLDLVTVGPAGVALRVVDAGRRLRDDGWRLPPDAPRGVREVRAVDADRDGRLDLVLGLDDGIAILLADGAGRYRLGTAQLLPDRAARR